ncbi:helix-turn-helix domain-containing protein [Nocardiopsis alborubida]|uniref:Helix-turn-helix domain-containing protein n=1 Tax=Nocardiopsis alborubida TaxID=146802 RepID=A0A7X6RQU3_9ACTN|nr:helix-turn-helix domain-containing protein [Nocardiopsis alborubida]NKY99144.1 helix-turn-helix domain-containing protein [Nocardiopsis alborubida]
MGEKVAYSVEEAAQALSLGQTTVKKLIATGRLPSVRVGRRRLIPRSALEDYVNQLIEDQAPA